MKFIDADGIAAMIGCTPDYVRDRLLHPASAGSFAPHDPILALFWGQDGVTQPGG